MAATPNPNEGLVEVARNCIVRMLGTARSAPPTAAITASVPIRALRYATGCLETAVA